MQVSALTFMITVISTGVGIVAAMFGFGVFFIRRLDNQTRELRAEIQGLRTEIEGVRTDFGTRLDNQTRELRAEIQEVRADFGTRLDNQTRDLRDEIAGVRTDLGSRMDRRFAQIDTRLDRVVPAAKPSAPDTAEGSPGDS